MAGLQVRTVALFVIAMALGAGGCIQSSFGTMSPTSAVSADAPASAAASQVTPSAQPPAAWTMAEPLAEPRWGHTASVLPDGRVLIVGGVHPVHRNVRDELETLASVEIFDPASGAWLAGPTLHTARAQHAAIVLADGRVLVLGGVALKVFPRADRVPGGEIFDPVTSAWKAIRPPPAEIALPALALLHDKRVIAVGMSDDPAGPEIAEVYDPSGDSWQRVAAPPWRRLGATATVLVDGTVLAEGGSTAGMELPDGRPDAAIFNPATGSWRTIAPLPMGTFGQTSTLLSDRRVVVVGSGGTAVFDLAMERWSRARNPAEPRIGHVAVALRDGRLLVVGSAQCDGGGSAELFDPSIGRWQNLGRIPDAGDLTATRLLDGRVLIVGGQLECTVDHAGGNYLFDPAAST
jgi:N-acetylneuraminic acid mutarotase